MAAKASAAGEGGLGQKLRGLAARCRELAEMTAVPEVSRELLSIARELEAEAEQSDRA